MQIMRTLVGEYLYELELPAPNEEVVQGVQWGLYDELFTPAFWRAQEWQHSLTGRYSALGLGRSLIEETAACLLGGYGMPAELGLAAYKRLADQGMLNDFPSAHDIEKELARPFDINGQERQYRFHRQKSRHLALCIEQLHHLHEPSSDRELRAALIRLPGVGPKTASWIVRNYRRSDQVAIIDVHILRAGRLASLFADSERPQSAYFALEEKFLDFASALGTKASILDNLIWDYMRTLGKVALGAARKHGSLRS